MRENRIAGSPPKTLQYATFSKGIVLNRKVLADLAMNEPKAFEAIVKAVK